MNIQDFIITGFDSILYARDKKGQTTCFENRYASCFIVTVSGKISFKSATNEIVSENGSPVFIAEGLSYVNECLEDAESYVFNFHTHKKCGDMCTLSPISSNKVGMFYEVIQKALVSQTPSSDMAVLRELYGLAELLFYDKGEMSEPERIVADAVSFMTENYHNSSLNIKNVAEACFVSEIYLRKLFAKFKGTTPFKTLTDIRMNRARTLAMEKRPIKEIALSVGYSDIYQFSRAYKKYFGYPPSVL